MGISLTYPMCGVWLMRFASDAGNKMQVSQLLARVLFNYVGKG